LLTDEQKLTDS